MSQNASADPTTILAGSAAPSDCEVVARKSADRRPVDDPSVTPRKGRSKVTNGSVLIAGVDQRNRWVRRARDIIARIFPISAAPTTPARPSAALSAALLS